MSQTHLPARAARENRSTLSLVSFYNQGHRAPQTYCVAFPTLCYDLFAFLLCTQTPIPVPSSAVKKQKASFHCFTPHWRNRCYRLPTTKSSDPPARGPLSLPILRRRRCPTPIHGHAHHSGPSPSGLPSLLVLSSLSLFYGNIGPFPPAYKLLPVSLIFKKQKRLP